jgi:hypothetical protein
VTVFRVPTDVLRAEMEGEQVLLNPQTGMYHLVNATGHALLQQMEDGATFEDAVRTLCERSGQPSERVESDAATFVDEMLDRGLLERVAATSN